MNIRLCFNRIIWNIILKEWILLFSGDKLDMVRDTPNLIHSTLRVVAVALVHFCQRQSSEGKGPQLCPPENRRERCGNYLDFPGSEQRISTNLEPYLEKRKYISFLS